jgi:hypothetical protein
VEILAEDLPGDDVMTKKAKYNCQNWAKTTLLFMHKL